jgi:uncharacterized protein (DUF302 family)
VNTPYAFTIELPQPLGPAIETLRTALGTEQMGIVSEVDLQATLKRKLGVDGPPQRLLGVCSPQVAHALGTAEPDITALLPCGCGVTETAPGLTRIALQDPRTIALASDNAQVRAACEIASAALRRVVGRLADAA